MHDDSDCKVSPINNFHLFSNSNSIENETTKTSNNLSLSFLVLIFYITKGNPSCLSHILD